MKNDSVPMLILKIVGMAILVALVLYLWWIPVGFLFAAAATIQTSPYMAAYNIGMSMAISLLYMSLRSLKGGK